MVPIRRRSRDHEVAVNARPYPRKGKTRFPAKLVDTRAILEYGYPYEEEGDRTIVKLALSKEQIDDLIERSREFKRSLEGRARSGSRERDRSPPRRRSPGPLVFDTPVEGPDSKDVRSTTEHRPPGWRHSTKRNREISPFSGD
ncbi:hypothetical protein BJX66DRAFT_49759 [Aspergillus keveii]|uniref:DUF8035 domain-containing protein n=1 Tax=Aspergillus keveii TaxID=714993 RepID=A0ABR4FRC7_9EURO